jgi:hypothetical protein
MSNQKKRSDFMALVIPKAKIRKQHLLKADLFRLRQVVGTTLKAGVTGGGDFILYTEDASSWQRLVRILPFMSDFREQRVDPLRTSIELLEVVDEDDPLFT